MLTAFLKTAVTLKVASGARPPGGGCCKGCKSPIYTSSVVNTHCVQGPICILFSTLTSKHRVCLKWHQNNRQTPKILPHRDRAPGYEIPGSATA